MHFSSGVHYFDISAAAQKYYAKLLDPVCKEWNLTRNELDVILFLHNNPEFDRAADIVSRRGISKSHVSLSVSGLEEKGILIRRFDENDRRTAHLELTRDGIRIADQGRELQNQYFAAMYRGISREELQIMKNIVLKVQENIQNFDNLL
jgi:MarR family transcriptional regulator for hemolysin